MLSSILLLTIPVYMKSVDAKFKLSAVARCIITVIHSVPVTLKASVL